MTTVARVRAELDKTRSAIRRLMRQRHKIDEHLRNLAVQERTLLRILTGSAASAADALATPEISPGPPGTTPTSASDAPPS